jgi:hypothetical protein
MRASGPSNVAEDVVGLGQPTPDLLFGRKESSVLVILVSPRVSNSSLREGAHDRY